MCSTRQLALTQRCAAGPIFKRQPHSEHATDRTCVTWCQIWHPDKHPENVEEAKQRFQEIQRAYDSLMTTDEDTRVEALGHK